ncbi:peroxidase family protein [Marinicella meishanensis]|uniref:peroxidase family protein n=1 Tax=Marinicella meishanensis TaxID=2873263 RepID=UPI001CC07C0B|nr:peroxidase family protein [Marinicella sp. NBU2979]
MQKTLFKTTLVLCFGAQISTASQAQNNPDQVESVNAQANPLLQQADAEKQQPAVSPVRRIDRSLTSQDALNARPGPPPGGQPPSNPPPQEVTIRTDDGSLNNLAEPSMGPAGQALLRLVPSDYSDGVSSLAGDNRASTRAISNAVSAQSESIPNEHQASDFGPVTT